tara:strand:- start:1277 stop:2434 length:1158 start_codon:yes stop_codon:yes gene_type:complete
MKSKNKIRIGFFTTTRAEFGLLSTLIKSVQKNNKFISFLFVGGSHTLKSYGKTINEIKGKKIKISKIFNYATSKDDPFSIAQTMSISSKRISSIFNNYNFDIVCVLGDRYEIIPIILNAILFKKIIVHIGGGESTQGLIDDQIRGMISKSAHIHFTSSSVYSKKLLGLGEESKRIFNVGSLSVDALKEVKKISKNQLLRIYKLDNLKPIAILTYHPVTLEFGISIEKQIKNMFQALSSFDINLIITSPNIEVESTKIKNLLLDYVKKNHNYYFFDSLGFEKYHQLLNHIDFVIGNSSSGIIEVPYYKKPTINIGIRQKNRLRHPSIIDVDYSVDSIEKGIKKSLSKKFLKSIKKMKYLFGSGGTTSKIVNLLINHNKIKDIMYKN